MMSFLLILCLMDLNLLEMKQLGLFEHISNLWIQNAFVNYGKK